MKNMLKLTLFLALVSALCTGILAGVNELTKERIAAQALGAETSALSELYPDASDFTVIDDFEADEAGLVTSVYRVDESHYVFRVSSQGYSAPVTFLIGFDNDGNDSRYVVLEQNDTAGIGDRIEADDYIDSMSGLSTTDSFPLLSGATFTTTAVQDGVSAAVEVFNAITGSTGGPSPQEPEPEAPVVSLVEQTEADGVITYTISSPGFAAATPNIFDISVDTATSLITAVTAIEVNDTPDISAPAVSEEYLGQYVGLSLSEGNVDIVSGVTFTSNSVQAAVDLVKELYVLDSAVKIEIEAVGYYPDNPNLVAVYFDPSDDTVLKVDIVEFNDTPGLGDQATTEERLAQYEGLAVGDPVEVDIVSGATVTSEAINKAVTEAMIQYQEGSE